MDAHVHDASDDAVVNAQRVEFAHQMEDRKLRRAAYGRHATALGHDPAALAEFNVLPDAMRLEIPRRVSEEWHCRRSGHRVPNGRT